MLESLRPLAILAVVLEEGSTKAAAERLNVSVSTIVQNISTLEQRLGRVLVARSSGAVKPTEFGAKLIGPARKMIEAAENSLDGLNDSRVRTTGTFVLSAPTMLSGGLLAEFTQDFLLAHPKVQMELRFENVQRHPIHNDVDLVIGLDAISHVNVAQRDLFGGGGGFFAAPDLAERIERTPTRDVPLKIPLLLYYGFGSNEWAHAFGHDVLTNHTDIPFRMKCDDVSVIYSMCLSGAGLTILPHSMVQKDLRSGRLVQVLKHISLQRTHFLALWNIQSKNVAVVERFLDNVDESLLHYQRLFASSS